MKKAIILVSFGTTFDKTRENTINKLEMSIKDKYSDFLVCQAFTSEIVIKRLAKRDIHYNNMSNTLQELKEKGVEEVFIQPTHILAGFEYIKFIHQMAKFKSDFISIKVGKPLLYTSDDYKMISEILKKEYLEEGYNIILMGHGTHHASNSTYPALNFEFMKKSVPIYVGTVESYPSLDDILDIIDNNKNIILAPLLFVAGDHATNDMASDEEDSWKSILKSKDFKVKVILKGLGEIEDIRQMYISHLDDIIKC